MLNKKSTITKVLLREIRSGELLANEMIPSRAQLMSRFHCSRTVVERVIADLTALGLLTSRQGKGTFVTSKAVNFRRKIRHIYVVSGYLAKSSKVSENCLLLNSENIGMPVELVSFKRADHECESMCQEDALTIFVNPGFEQLPLMDYLKKRDLPPLVINREFDGFDRIYTDTLAGFRDGVAYLKSCPGDRVTVVGREPVLQYPYQASRLLNFYRSCAEVSLEIDEKNSLIYNFTDVPREIAQAELIFAAPHPRIAVINADLTQALLEFAASCGKVPGRDFSMLAFEYLAAANVPGVAMIRQKYSSFYDELKRFIANDGNFPAGSFVSAVAPELVVAD